MGRGIAIGHRFSRHHHPVVVLQPVNRRGPDTATGGQTGHYQRIHPALSQARIQIGVVKGAGPLFLDQDITVSHVQPFIDLDPVRPGLEHIEGRHPFPKNPGLVIAAVDHSREVHRQRTRVKFIHQTGVGCDHFRTVIPQGAGGIGEPVNHIHDYQRGFTAKAQALTFQIHAFLKILPGDTVARPHPT